MKNNMKKIAIVMMVIMIAVCLFAFTACDKDAVKAKVTVVMASGDTPVEYVVDMGKEKCKTILDVLNYLKEKKDVNFVYSGEGDSAFILELGDMKPDANNHEFISVYTSVEKDYADWGAPIEYKGTHLETSGNGVYGMAIEDGMIAYFVIATW